MRRPLPNPPLAVAALAVLAAAACGGSDEGDTTAAPATTFATQASPTTTPSSDLFHAEQRSPLGTGFYAMSVFDLDADDYPDLLVAPQSGSGSTFRGNGDGSFHLEGSVSARTFITQGDLNGDGFTDIVSQGDTVTSVAVLLGSGSEAITAAFGDAQSVEVGHAATAAALADMDGDGLLDIVTADDFANEVSVVLQASDGTFEAPHKFAVGEVPLALSIGDLDGDGMPDVVTGNARSNDVSVLLNDGAGGLLSETRFRTGDGPVDVAIADVNTNGALDVVTVNQLSEDVSVLHGIGDGRLQPDRRYPVGDGPIALAIDDVDADGIPDIMTANQGNVLGGAPFTGDVSLLLGDGLVDFEAQEPLAVGEPPSAIALADVNGDGAIDILTVNFEAVSVLLHK